MKGFFNPWYVAKQEDEYKSIIGDTYINQHRLVKGLKYCWWQSIIEGNIKLILFISQVIVSTTIIMAATYQWDYIPVLSALIIIISLIQFSNNDIFAEYYDNKANNRLKIFQNLCQKLIEKNYITEDEYYRFYIEQKDNTK